MVSFKVLFWLVYVGGFGSYQQVINVALDDNGGICSTSLSVSCNKLNDGEITRTSFNKWQVSGNITGQTITFTFASSVLLERIEFIHAYNSSDRNIKRFSIVINEEFIKEFELANRNIGRNEKDTFEFSDPPLADTLTLEVTAMYITPSISILIEIEIYGTQIYGDTMSATSGSTSLVAISTASIEPVTSLMTLSTSSTTSPTTRETTSTYQTESTTTTRPTTKLSSSSQPTSTLTVTKTTITTASASTIATSSSSSTKSSTLSTQTTSMSSIGITEQDIDSRKLGLIIGLVMAFLVIFAVVLIVVCIVMRRRKRQRFDYEDKDQHGYVNFSMDKIDHAPEAEENNKNQYTVVKPPNDVKLSDSSPESSPESSVQDLTLVDGEPENANTQPLPVYSNAIKWDNLASTVDDMLQNPEKFQEEFKSIPAGKQHPTTFADRSTLHTKNRFRNIKPYDHSRVSLIQKESDDSMYINANFISAYSQPKYYIAAQGPNKDSVDDFWRMIWEHHVPVIVMVTNCKEAGKDKCIQYWPNKEDSKQTYDDVDVVFDKNIIAADYKILDFKISKCGETRDVRQYHYTSWPDEGVPTSCSALISFVNRIREYTDDKEPPIVVHCSAGVGRTGTFIAVNYSMDMASHEKIVDIQKVVHRLREDRINMVQTLSQYKFLYALMLECLYCGEVTIPCQGASEKIQQIFIKTYGQDSPAEQQWKVLEVFKSKNLGEECLAGKHKDNIEKNRTQDIVPLDNHRPYLRRRPDYTSNYINAVFVDGYKTKNKFLLTQHPLENTIVDLWRTISDFNISTIVMLNSCSDDVQTYWPEDEYSEPLKYGDFLEVTFKRVDKQDEFTITELQISEDKEKANVLTHIQVKNWSEDSKPKLSILPALYNIVTQAQMADEDSRIMIHNLNGDGNTGVYCALHQIFDKIKEEQEIDIFNAVKNTRMSRPDAIPDMDTYRYLHDASVQFIEQFSTYANLQ